MNRRTLLRTSAAAVGGGGAAIAGLQLLAADSAAATALTLDVVGDSATLDADDSVAAVWVDLSVEWAYDLPGGASPDTAVVEIAAAEGDAEPAVVASAESAQLFTSAEGTESFEIDLLDGVLADVAPDSGARETDVTIEARLRVLDGETVLARDAASDTATISVERELGAVDEHGSIGGSGALTIEIA